MEMKRIEAETLEEAYSKAAKELSCSITEINYEIIQHPNAGVMGLFKKNAMIIAVRKTPKGEGEDEKTSEVEDVKVKEPKNSSITITPKKKSVETKEAVVELKPEKETPSTTPKTEVRSDKDEIVDEFFSDKTKTNSLEKIKKVNKEEKRVEVSSSTTKDVATLADEEFGDFDDDRDSPENKELSLKIEGKIKKLMDVACFEIDTVEVDVFNGIAHIFLDGEDAALLIGKEGYRYNALSYMLFNWIHATYSLYIKLEIAEFIQAQEEMIENYLTPIAAHIVEHGKGKTKPLDGILVQIALEKLRAMFPNKYIAIKTAKDGKKFIIINNFNTKKPS